MELPKHTVNFKIKITIPLILHLHLYTLSPKMFPDEFKNLVHDELVKGSDKLIGSPFSPNQ